MSPTVAVLDPDNTDLRNASALKTFFPGLVRLRNQIAIHGLLRKPNLVPLTPTHVLGSKFLYLPNLSLSIESHPQRFWPGPSAVLSRSLRGWS